MDLNGRNKSQLGLQADGALKQNGDARVRMVVDDDHGLCVRQDLPGWVRPWFYANVHVGMCGGMLCFANALMVVGLDRMLSGVLGLVCGLGAFAAYNLDRLLECDGAHVFRAQWVDAHRRVLWGMRGQCVRKRARIVTAKRKTGSAANARRF